MTSARPSKDWAEARASIFGLYSELDVREEDRHALQKAVTGESSLRSMSDEQHQDLIGVLSHLAEHGAQESLELDRLKQGEALHDVLPSWGQQGLEHEPNTSNLKLKVPFTLGGKRRSLAELSVSDAAELTLYSALGLPDATLKLEHRGDGIWLEVFTQASLERPALSYLLIPEGPF